MKRININPNQDTSLISDIESVFPGTEIFERTAFVYTSRSTSLRPELLLDRKSVV